MSPKNIHVRDLKEKMDRKEDFVLLDVREDFEREICKLSPDKHIPMSQIQSRLGELPKDAEILVYCRSGGRSMNVCGFLESQGYANVTNVGGGILAWSDHVDPTVQKY